MAQTTKQAIEQSIRQNEIVTLPYTSEAAADLLIECDDSVENGDVAEFWGVDSDGSSWRVHLRGAREVE